jgi:hypothetical protein
MDTQQPSTAMGRNNIKFAPRTTSLNQRKHTETIIESSDATVDLHSVRDGGFLTRTSSLSSSRSTSPDSVKSSHPQAVKSRHPQRSSSIASRPSSWFEEAFPRPSSPSHPPPPSHPPLPHPNSSSYPPNSSSHPPNPPSHPPNLLSNRSNPSTTTATNHTATTEFPPRKIITPQKKPKIPIRHVSLPRFTTDELLDQGYSLIAPSPITGRLQPQDAKQKWTEALQLSEKDRDLFRELKCLVNIALTKDIEESYIDLRSVLDRLTNATRISKRSNAWTNLAHTSLEDVEEWLCSEGKKEGRVETTSHFQRRKAGGGWNVGEVPTKAGITHPDPLASPVLLVLVLDLFHNLALTSLDLDPFEAVAWWQHVLDLCDRLQKVPGGDYTYIRRQVIVSSVRTWTCLGFVMSGWKRHAQAMQCLDVALEIISACEESISISTPATFNIGKSLPKRTSSKGDDAGCMKHFVAVLNQLKASCYSHLATAHESLGHVQVAISMRKSAMDCFAKCGDVTSLARERVNHAAGLYMLWKSADMNHPSDVVSSALLRVLNFLGDQWMFCRRLGETNASDAAGMAIAELLVDINLPHLALHFVPTVSHFWLKPRLLVASALATIVTEPQGEVGKYSWESKDEVLKSVGQNPALWNRGPRDVPVAFLMTQNVIQILKSLLNQGVDQDEEWLKRVDAFWKEECTRRLTAQEALFSRVPPPLKRQLRNARRIPDDQIVILCELIRFSILNATGEVDWQLHLSFDEVEAVVEKRKEWMRLGVECMEYVLGIVFPGEGGLVERMQVQLDTWMGVSLFPMDPTEPLIDSSVIVLVHTLFVCSSVMELDSFPLVLGGDDLISKMKQCADCLLMAHALQSCPTCFNLWQTSAQKDLEENGVVFGEQSPQVEGADDLSRAQTFHGRPVHAINLPTRSKSVKLNSVFHPHTWGSSAGARHDTFSGLTKHLCSHFKSFQKMLHLRSSST